MVGWPCGQFSRNAGCCGGGYDPLVGEIMVGPACIPAPPGGRRTLGLLGSMKLPFLDMIEPAGETILSRAMDDRLLSATLGEYTLPPYALVRLLEKPPPPIEQKRPRPRPKPCS